MGQRANLFIIGDGVTEMFYTHHCANTLDQDLFWGPQYALASIRSQQPSTDWLDEVWSEGGAVMDRDRHVLLWYGGEDMMYDVPLRRCHAQLMQRLWPGWTIRWACEGIADLADYLGEPRATVTSPRSDPELSKGNFDGHFGPRHADDDSGEVVTVRWSEGDIRFYFTRRVSHRALAIGLRLVEILRGVEGASELDLADLKRFPDGGVHIDVTTCTVEYWVATAWHTINSAARHAPLWPGWTLRWHGDRFESQLELADGRLKFREPSRQKLVDSLGEILLRPDNGQSGAEMIARVAGLLAKDGQNVEINPGALRDARLILPLEQRKQLFAVAAGA